MPINTLSLTRVALAAVLCIAVFPPHTVRAQSLGDVARRTEEQRKAAASKVYTNDNVAPSDQPSTPPLGAEASAKAAAAAPPASPAAAPAGQTPAPQAAKPSGDVIEEDKATGHTNVKTAPGADRRDEQYWRQVIGDVRAKLAKLNADIATQQARLDQVDGDTPAAVREREVLSGTIERLQKDIALQNSELKRWLTRASIAKAPEEWTR